MSDHEVFKIHLVSDSTIAKFTLETQKFALER